MTNKLVEQITEGLNQWTINHNKAIEGNKAAARRARVATLKLEKLFKEYRKESIADC